MILLIFTEFNTGTAADRATILFKSGTKLAVLKEAEAAVRDEGDKEKVAEGKVDAANRAFAMKEGKSMGNGNGDGKNPDRGSAATEEEKAKEAMKEQPKMVNVFSWEGLRYEVKVAGEMKVLLDNVSGFVAPGKLTALMGESGAGKVCSSDRPFRPLSWLHVLD